MRIKLKWRKHDGIHHEEKTGHDFNIDEIQIRDGVLTCFKVGTDEMHETLEIKCKDIIECEIKNDRRL